MSQQEIDRHLDRITFLDCMPTIRAWLEYHHSLGKKAIAVSAKWKYELVDEGMYYAMLDEIQFNYFQGLG